MKRRVNSSSFFRNRTGDFSLDLLWIVGVLFIIGVSWILVGWAFSEVNNDLTIDFDLNDEALQSLEDTHDKFNDTFDGALAFVFFAMSFFVIISAWFLDTFPVFFVLGVIILGLSIGVIVTLANSFEEIVTDEDFSSTSDEWKLTIFIFSHIVELVVSIAFLTSIVLYGKNRFGGFG